MLGTIINVVSIIFGGLIGLIFHKKSPRVLGERIMEGFGLFVIVIGIKGAIVGNNSLLYIVSIILGALIGESLKLEKRLNSFSGLLEKKFVNNKNEGFKEGFITTTILFCVGAMAIIGPMNGVLKGNYEILMIKSTLDGVTAFIFASAYGFSVLFSAISVLVYQGLVSLLAILLKDFLSLETINNFSVVGSLLVAGIGFNMLKISSKKINVVNLLPAIFIPILYEPLKSIISYIKGII